MCLKAILQGLPSSNPIEEQAPNSRLACISRRASDAMASTRTRCTWRACGTARGR